MRGYILKGTALVAIAIATCQADSLITQSFDLKPGWNAIYLQVEPPTNLTREVTRTLPLSSIWTYVRPTDSAQFIQNLSENLHNDPRWLAFFPTNRYESMFNNLFVLHGGRPYFLKIEGGSNVTWNVTGVPVVPQIRWAPNAFNLVGFPLDPAVTQPSLAAFLGPDSNLTGQACYRIATNGIWRLVSAPASESLAADEAIWVRAGGESSYQGLLEVGVQTDDGLDFGGSLSEREVTLRNNTGASMSVSLRDMQGTGGFLSYWTINNTTIEWLPLPDPLTVIVPANGTTKVRLGIRRVDMTSDLYTSTLEVKGDQGTRVLLPVSARKSEATVQLFSGETSI